MKLIVIFDLKTHTASPLQNIHNKMSILRWQLPIGLCVNAHENGY
jgi:hypothetical protein